MRMLQTIGGPFFTQCPRQHRTFVVSNGKKNPALGKLARNNPQGFEWFDDVIEHMDGNSQLQ